MHDTKRKSSFRTKEVQNEPKSKKQKHSHVYPLWYVVFSQKTKPMQWAETVWVEMFPTFFARTFCTLFFLPGELHRDKRMGLPGPNPGCPGLGVCSGPCKKKSFSLNRRAVGRSGEIEHKFLRRYTAGTHCTLSFVINDADIVFHCFFHFLTIKNGD